MDLRVQTTAWARASAAAQRLAGAAAQRLATFAHTAPPVPGVGQAMAQGLNAQRSPRAQQIAESKEARYGRLTYGAGPMPARFSTYPATGLTPERIYQILVMAETTGLCYQKADLTQQILRRDSHLAAVDHTVRTRASGGADWRIKPYDESPLSAAIARYVRAWWHDIDGLDGALYGLLLAHADGYAIRESVDQWKKIRFQGVNGESVTVWGDLPRQLDFVHNKHVRFDTQTDEPLIDVGGGQVISIPRGKLIFHAIDGDGLIETRGHIQATGYLHCISHNAIVRWAIYLAQFGLDQVAYVVDRAAYENAERRTQYESFVANIGNGIPAVMTDEGKLEITKSPGGGGQAGVHAALVGWANNEKSKRTQGEQLTTEVGGNGAGYNTSETQAQVQDAWVRSIGKGLAGSLRAGFVKPYLEKNKEALAAALGAPPDEIVAHAPWLIPHTQRPLSPAVMIQVLDRAKNGLGLELGADEVREMLGLNPPREGDELPGATVILPKGGAAVPTAEAQAPGGTDNPDLAATAAAGAPAAPAGAGAAGEAAVPGIDLTSTDLATIVTVNEARKSKGLPPLPVDGELTIAEYKAKHSGVVAEAAAAEDGVDKDRPAPAGMAAFASTDRSEDPGVMIALYPPPELAAQLELEGGEPAAELHLTLAYLGRLSKLARPLERVPGVLQRVAAPPLEGVVGGVGRFAASETSDGRDVLYASVDMPGLAALREKIVATLDEFGFAISEAHGFTPHMTLAYLDPAAPSPLQRLAPVPVRFTEFWLVCGAQRQRFPLFLSSEA